MSTDLITYLNYMANWENASDENIQRVIDEQILFKNLGDFESDDAVSEEFSELVELAVEVRNLSISAASIQIGADAAAVAAFWEFGLGMAAYLELEVIETCLKRLISGESGKLNTKLSTADLDIAGKINNNLLSYVDKYKKNNRFIPEQAPKGMDTRHARANLMQFMAQVDREFKEKGGLNVENFKRLSKSARIAFKGPEIAKVYDALDELNMGDKTEADVKKFAVTVAEYSGSGIPVMAIDLVQCLGFFIANKKLKVSSEALNEEFEAAGLKKATCVDAILDAAEKFAFAVTIAMSVIDVVMEIHAIVDIVEQCQAMCDRLREIEIEYKRFFNGIKNSSKAYNKAIQL